MGFMGVYGGLWGLWGFMEVYGDLWGFIGGLLGFLGVPLVNGGSDRGFDGFVGFPGCQGVSWGVMGVFEGNKATRVKSA